MRRITVLRPRAHCFSCFSSSSLNVMFGAMRIIAVRSFHSHGWINFSIFASHQEQPIVLAAAEDSFELCRPDFDHLGLRNRKPERRRDPQAEPLIRDAVAEIDPAHSPIGSVRM